MIREITTLFALAVSVAACAPAADDFTTAALDYCAAQSRRSLDCLPADYTVTPRNVAPGAAQWHTRPVCKEEWTEGFWPGILWYDYEYTGDERFRTAAEGYTEALDFITRGPAYDHDTGFIIFCSYGNGYRLTGRKDYREAILRTADYMAELFDPAAGTILSWPREVPAFGGHNTIMDNMINLETLFWAAEQTGDNRYADIARSHADRTMLNNFREDGTSYHVAVYALPGGEFLRGCTHQGYADDSMWARGQAWGIYGFTMCYRFTGDKRYRDFAARIADVYTERLPEDMVPYWDFDDPRIPDAPRDASAAAVVASALLELSTYFEGGDSARFRDSAERMLRSLDAGYRSGERNPSFLLHSTGHHPAGSEIDYSIIYADYYFIEALTRLHRLEQGLPVVD